MSLPVERPVAVQAAVRSVAIAVCKARCVVDGRVGVVPAGAEWIGERRSEIEAIADTIGRR